MPKVSSPFGASKTWLLQKFIEKQRELGGNALAVPLDHKNIDDLMHFWLPEQLYIAILDFAKQCSKDGRHFNMGTFSRWVREYERNVPTPLMASIKTLKLHYKADPEKMAKLDEYQREIEARENSWFGGYKSGDNAVAEVYIEELKARL